MKLSKRLRKWKDNLTTQTPIDYVIMLREDVNGFADEVKALERENVKLRELIRTVWLAGDFRAFLGADEIKERMRELGIEVE